MNDEKYFQMCQYELEYAEKGITVIGGIDEAGRGPLAGPVVAACVFFENNGSFVRADDSKKLSEAKRELMYDEIISNCVSWGVGIVDNNKIDEINILNATKLAMREACVKAISKLPRLEISKTAIFIDHVKLEDMPCDTLSITHGDALSVSIAAASIIAKVTRDRMMVAYEDTYPGYGFALHKGYGTKKHYDAIKTLGISNIHRKSFLKKFNGV